MSVTAEHVIVEVRGGGTPGVLERSEAGDTAVIRVLLPDLPAGQALERPLAGLPGAARLVPAGTGSRLELRLDWHYPCEVSSTSEDLVRLTIPLAGRESAERELAEGVTVVENQRWDSTGLNLTWFVHLTPEAAAVLKVVPAGETIFARRTVQAIAEGAIAAVNGGFFDPASGAPLGALRIDGEWWRMPLFERTALLLPDDGPPRIESVDWQGMVEADGELVPLPAFNTSPPDTADGAAFSRRWGRSPELAGSATRREEPATGLVTFWRRPAELGAVRLPIGPAATVLGAGPRLARAGALEVTGEQERFRPDVLASRTARAGVGVTEVGGLVLGFADGRRPWSAGLTLDGWARALIEQGCLDAVNLDGGPSATMVLAGDVVGHPLAGEAVPVANALCVRPR